MSCSICTQIWINSVRSICGDPSTFLFLLVRWGLRVRLRGRRGRGELWRWPHRAESQKPEMHTQTHRNTQWQIQTMFRLNIYFTLDNSRSPREEFPQTKLGLGVFKLRNQLKKNLKYKEKTLSFSHQQFRCFLKVFPLACLSAWLCFSSY